MSQKLPPNTVSLHPYFKAHPGELNTFKALLPKFVAKTSTEDLCLFYGFTINGDEIFCREAYIGAEGVALHLENVGELLGQALKNSDLTRLEVHGPAEELDKLREGMEELNPAWFVYETGLGD